MEGAQVQLTTLGSGLRLGAAPTDPPDPLTHRVGQRLSRPPQVPGDLEAQAPLRDHGVVTQHGGDGRPVPLAAGSREGRDVIGHGEPGVDAQVHEDPGQAPAAGRQTAEAVLGRGHEPELVGEGLGVQAPALVASGDGPQVALPGGQARAGGVRTDVDVVARDRLMQDRGALHPRPHQLLAVGQGAHDDAGPTLSAGTARLLVVDGAVSELPEAHPGAAQAVGRVEEPADDGVPGLVGDLLRPGRVVLRAQGVGRVDAQVPVEAAGIGAGP